MISFLKEFWEFLKIRKKILVTTNINCFSIIWSIDSIEPRLCCSSIHLHYILNVNNTRYISLFHDSAASIIKDGEIIAAAQEERFSRKKHDERFPLMQLTMSYRRPK